MLNENEEEINLQDVVEVYEDHFVLSLPDIQPIHFSYEVFERLSDDVKQLKGICETDESYAFWSELLPLLNDAVEAKQAAFGEQATE